MATYCTIHPKVKVGDEFQDSVLYGQIREYTFGSYEPTNNIYFSAKRGDDTKLKNPEYNSQGELTLKSLLQNFDIRGVLPLNFEQKLKEHFRLEDKNYSVDNYHELLQQCEELNSSVYGTDYFATISINDGIITPILNYKTSSNKYKKQQEEQHKANELYTKVSNILERWGIKVDALNDAEERLTDGLVDFSSIEKATDGFYHIIRIAKGIKGEEALPEELGHVIVRAMEDTPLMQRTLNLLKNNEELIQEILGDNYEKYSEEYANDLDLLAEETAGKLVAIHFLQEVGIEDNKIYSKILGRTINSIENFFKRFNETELSNAVYEVNETLSMIVRSTVAGNENVNPMRMRIGNILKQINNTQDRVKNLERVNNKILQNELKRLKIYKNSKAVRKETSKLIVDINAAIKRGDLTSGILKFIDHSNDEVKAVLNQLQTIQDYDADIQTRSSVLRNCRNVIFSYLNILKEVQKDLQSEFAFKDNDLSEQITPLLNECLSTLGTCLSVYNMHAMNLMETFWTNVLGEDLKTIKGVWKPREIHYSIKDLLEMNVEDISVFDRFLDSVAHSNSYILKGMDKIVKERNNNARLRTIEFNKRLAALTKELEQAGYKNQNWMFEVNSDGHKTGFYIKKDSDEYKKLSAAQKKYYDAVIKMKEELEALNPPSKQNIYRTVKIRKDLLERVKSSTDIKSAIHSFTEAIKEGFIRNSTETEYKNKSFISDFEGFEYQELPIFYTYLGKDTSEDDISMDIVSTMTAYAANVFKNDEMAGIIDMLELTRAQLRTAQNPIETQAQKRMREVTGKYKRKDTSNIVARMNDFFDMQVYGRTKADEGTIGSTKIDTSKVISRWIDWNSSVNTAFNVLMNISNVMTGNVQFKLEAIGGQFFAYKDAMAADKIFASRAKDFVTDAGNRTKSSWFYVVSEYFNVMQDYDNEIAHTDFDKRWYERFSLNGLSMIAQNAGEIWMQHRTFFALMHSDKEALTDKEGKKVLAINAFEVKPLNPAKPHDGAELIFKKGLKTKEGKLIVTKEELKERAKQTNKSFTDNSLLKENEISEMDYVNKMSRKSAALNQYMHGIYNEADKAALYKRGWGRLVGQYRKWIRPSLNRRFKVTTYNYDLDSFVEGSYITAARTCIQYYRDIRAKQFDIKARWNEMNDYEKANLRKVNAEIATLIIIAICLAMLPDDDDDTVENTYLSRMYRYQLYRLRTEIGTLVPGPSMVTEGLKILKSPAAGISTLERVANCWTIITPWNWKEIESGRYKGWYRPWNSVMDLVPYHRAIWRTLHPEEGIKYYL